MNLNVKHIAIIHPAGKNRISNEKRNERIEKIKNLGFLVTEILPQQNSLDGVTAGPVLERACLLSYALTMRKFDILFAARGGMGCTELIPYLENLLPPVISDKILVGFSDISFLGVYLGLRFPNFKYIHGQNSFSPNLLSGPMLDQKALFELLNHKPTAYNFPVDVISSKNIDISNEISGKCIPLNLSLAESVAAIQYLNLPEDNILFLEECNEHLYRILRKFDSLINSEFLAKTKAIVIGNFSDCFDPSDRPLSRELLLNILAKKTNLPVIDFPLFGHEEFRFPLLMKSEIIIKKIKNKFTIKFTNEIKDKLMIATNFPANLFTKNNDLLKKDIKIHLTGIGGTGMAQVAGLFKAANYKVTGSDTPIYPPMDKVIADLGIKPDVGFLAENIQKNNPDAVILANVVSRLSASLKKNEELEELLQQTIPLLSFPSALRKYFLAESTNIIISGTHGKTTTSSLVTHLLTQIGKKPSFLIGGRPANFDAGFSFQSKDLFVLEGDEYDSAFFDKGPKFLHYEPKICLINNIEFDHADIYANVEAIEAEFLRLAKLTKERNGIVIANFDDIRAKKVALESGAFVIGFSAHKQEKNSYCWQLKSYKTLSNGIEVECKQPNGKLLKFKSSIFGQHNALNSIAAVAILAAHQIIEDEKKTGKKRSLKYEENKTYLAKITKAMTSFKGVKRRFELLREKNNITVFDDFAHHPTAIVTTLEAFRSYMKSVGKKGRLIACFDPRNATMRRRVLQDQLAKSFFHADEILLGKVPQDLRMNKEEVLDGPAVALACGENAKYFDDNEKLLVSLKQQVRPGDTIVFMSSGSFDGIPARFAKEL
ncbi:Mur ligase family protein [Pigmentibacter sp. JX0631]|uniref:Mur ligase family protein n=1 Tax=Pigmentibacter sp. JX0631 TaxID=2976982 RepID=UPI0024692BCE|nr:Mur ligase family protein [Pigmentibacter sp. JX0631]WGL59069.1 Mur ligase family protein [Pigmentibacter sp. JX0631]